MKPCKLTSPTFAVTAAVLGGIALAASTCQGATLVLEPVNAYTLTSEYDPVQGWIVDGIDPELFQDYDRERTINRLEFTLPQFDPSALAAAELTMRLPDYSEGPPFSLLNRQALYAFPGTRPVQLGDPWDSQVRGDRTRVFFDLDPPTSAEINIDVADFLHSPEFAQADAITLTLDFSMYARRSSAVVLSTPRLAITTIPEPTPPILGTLALLLFLTRRRRGAPVRTSIAPSHPRPRG